ncbi:unnamed protein product [Lepeophtheirus salmonis]|uniref:(salmon louse) hypothetical protein n=1 Tax=Lepeophtheirus salmonis TaxID=72036 RepID=A0A7R8HD44_LEPSM|nr:unnamed protein product [Lepeophtheirus salmonis]CAF3023294.1 unnamed protein product [Lepeophtheirus salmonis]
MHTFQSVLGNLVIAKVEGVLTIGSNGKEEYFSGSARECGSLSGFLPSLEKAQKDLEARMARRENVNVEDVSRGKYVEMEILKAREEGDEEHWTSDSDPDSPPSSDINDNDFTSDTDSDSSSSTCSSTSSSSASPPPRKRPLIQVLPDKKQTK